MLLLIRNGRPERNPSYYIHKVNSGIYFNWNRKNQHAEDLSRKVLKKKQNKNKNCS